MGLSPRLKKMICSGLLLFGEPHFVVRTTAVRLLRLWIPIANAQVVAKNGLVRPPLEKIVRLERHFSPSARQIDGEMRNRQSTGVPPQAFDDLDPFGDGRSKMLQALSQIHL